jgi:hypothetical protein
MMLQHMPIRSHQGVLDEAGAGNGSISFGSLWELLLLLALKQDNVLVRCVGGVAVGRVMGEVMCGWVGVGASGRMQLLWSANIPVR